MALDDKSRVWFDVEGELGILRWFNEPANLITFQTTDALAERLEEVARADIRALLIETPGPNFCGGVNVAVFKDLSAREGRARFASGLPSVIQGIENLPFPVVVAVQGLCSAAGLEIALTADIIFAGRSAQFSQVEARIGASTFLGGAQRLAERCGSARAKEICFTARHYKAETFERWNIVNFVTDDDAVQAEAKAFALTMAAGPTQAHAVTKRIVRAYADGGVHAADDALLGVASPLFETHDMQHGVQTLLSHGPKDLTKHTKFLGK